MKFDMILRSLILLIDYVFENHLNADKPIWLLSGYCLYNFLPSIRRMQLELFIKIHAFTKISYHNYLTTGMNSSNIQNRIDLHKLQKRNMKCLREKELFKWYLKKMGQKSFY